VPQNLFVPSYSDWEAASINQKHAGDPFNYRVKDVQGIAGGWSKTYICASNYHLSLHQQINTDDNGLILQEQYHLPHHKISGIEYKLGRIAPNIAKSCLYVLQ